MQILNIAGYQFEPLTDLATFKSQLKDLCQSLNLKGTILLSTEGINISLAGSFESITQFLSTFKQDSRFEVMHFHESVSEVNPFQVLKIKLKKEIITMKQPSVDVNQGRAPGIAPEILKQWLDEGRDITLLDTRNDYEMELGTFEGAKQFPIGHFSQLANKINEVPRNKPIVMFCTGGVRCEKAAIYMQQQGYQEVYQLDGGILKYFSDVGQQHYNGDCFVFDERIAINATHMRSK